MPLRRLFHKYMNKPLYLENDGNCAAVGEYYAGAGRRSKRFVTITLGTGIGGGIIHNGKIYHGSNGMAGEVGHMSIEYNGKSCPCGRKGCWERYASASALKWLTQRVMEENPDVYKRQLQGTPFCQVIIMDELGFMESDAQAFRRAVLQTLDGETPVLAAVKNRMDVEFLRQVCAHPRAEVVPINPENREELFRTLLPVVSGWKK